MSFKRATGRHKVRKSFLNSPDLANAPRGVEMAKEGHSIIVAHAEPSSAEENIPSYKGLGKPRTRSDCILPLKDFKPYVLCHCGLTSQ
jgi:hypothetical protein